MAQVKHILDRLYEDIKNMPKNELKKIIKESHEEFYTIFNETHFKQVDISLEILNSFENLNYNQLKASNDYDLLPSMAAAA
jgi:hypothetical protein